MAFAVVTALGAACPPARAGDDTADNEQKAFAHGLERFRRGDLRGAIDVWSRLLQTLGAERGWRVTYNLGRAYEKVGDPTRAIEHFTAFLAVAERQTGAVAAESAAAVKDARARVAAIEESHGVLEVEAPAAGVVLVRVGLAEPRSAGFKLYLKPGKHVLTLRPGSSRESSETIELRAGQKVTRSPEGDPAPRAAGRGAGEAATNAEPPTRDSKPSESSRFPTPWVGIGAAATLVASGVSFALYRRAESEREDALALGPKSAGYAAAKDDYDSAYRTYQFSLLAPALLGAATVTLVVLSVTSSGDPGVSLGISPTRATLEGAF